MVIEVPNPAADGLKELITGAGINVKPDKLAEPPAEVTPTEPVAPVPTIAMIVVDERTVNEETAVPPKVTLVAPVKSLPVMVIEVPNPAAVGLKELITGAGINVKPNKLAEPPAEVTPTEPVAPLPTIALMVVDETTVNEATAVPPKVTLVAPVKLLPVMVIEVPNPAVVGLMELITGAGINVKPDKLAEPPAELTPTEPDDPLPTIALMVVDETTVNEETAVPPKVTLVAPVKLLPVIVIEVPKPAVVGLKELITGAGINVKPDKLAEPPAEVTPTEPVDPLPTIATIEVDDTTVNDVTGVPPNVIIEVPVKFVPVMLMIAPAAAVTGAKDVIVGAGAGGKYV
jgi:hypothetical protein